MCISLCLTPRNLSTGSQSSSPPSAIAEPESAGTKKKASSSRRSPPLQMLSAGLSLGATHSESLREAPPKQAKGSIAVTAASGGDGNNSQKVSVGKGSGTGQTAGSEPSIQPKMSKVVVPVSLSAHAGVPGSLKHGANGMGTRQHSNFGDEQCGEVVDASRQGTIGNDGESGMQEAEGTHVRHTVRA